MRMGRGGRVREKLSHGEGVSDKMTLGRGRGWGEEGEERRERRGGRREGEDGEKREERGEEDGEGGRVREEGVPLCEWCGHPRMPHLLK